MTRDAVRLRSRAGDLPELLRLAGPVIMARLGIMAMGLTDSIVVGRFSATQLGYHALGWAPTSAIVVAAVGLLQGVQVMTSRYVGAGRLHDTGAVFRRGLVYAFWIGAASAAALALLGPAFLHALGLGPGLADGATRPLRVLSLSLPPYLMSVAATAYLEALGRPKVGMTVMWIANIVNLGLNLWLVPGGHGVPALGAVGAAWATFGSRSFLAVVLIAYVLMLKEARALGVFDKPSDGRAAAKEQRRIGYAAGISLFVEGAAFSGMSLIAGKLGAVEVAAWAVVLNVTGVIFMAPLGLGTATAVLVGRAYGARDEAGVVRWGVLGFLVSAVASIVVIAFVWPGAGLIAHAYSREPAVIPIIAGALALSCLFFMADGLQAVAAQALRARGDIWLPTAIHMFNYVALMLPLAWLFALSWRMGVNGIVWSVTVASLASGGLLVGRYLWLSRAVLWPAQSSAKT
jgi:MATE family multidrug resistance protein